MAALTAANFTIVITGRERTTKRKMHRGTLTFGNGTDTYSTAGIPLPTKDKFGFSRVMEDLVFVGVNGLTANYSYAFNKAAHKLQMFGDRAAAAAGLPHTESTSSEAPAARTLNFIAYGW